MEGIAAAKPSILKAIGDTPLVRLNKVVPEGSATVLAKCEHLNPTGSIKDRIALHIIEEAEKSGDLKPGGTIVENTSGNTGLALAMVAAVKGHKCIFTLPDKMSQEKIDALKAFGAQVVVTPTDVPGDSPDHYVNTAKRLAEETPGAFYVNQYHNAKNTEAHCVSTGQEIWEQTGGKVDVFVAGAGTGGTVSGVGKWFKQQGSETRIVGVDPLGSVHYHYFNTGTLPDPYVYKVEGVGEDIPCDAFEMEWVDEMRQVSDAESFAMARCLVREEGIFCGGSSGSVIHVAVKIAQELGPGKTVVAILCDSGTRYVTKYLSDAWMRDHGFMENTPSLGRVEDLLARKNGQEILTAGSGEPIGDLVARMREKGVSQLPILGDGGKPVGIVHEVDILHALHDGAATMSDPASAIAKEPGGLVYPKARLEELYAIFEQDQTALVIDDRKLVGIISQIDFIDFLGASR